MVYECSEPPSLKQQFADIDLRILKVNQQAKIYDDILTLRSQVYGISKNECAIKGDEYSEHYCAYVGSIPLATLRATRAAFGKIECEEYYPHHLLAHYRDKISSATRFCSINKLGNKINIGLILLKTVWYDQIKQGIRIDIINVRENMIRYYQRLGYLIVSGSAFIHPVWKTRSIVMIMLADPHHHSAFRPIFTTLNDYLTLKDIINQVRICAHSIKIMPNNSICACFADKENLIDCLLIDKSESYHVQTLF